MFSKHMGYAEVCFPSSPKPKFVIQQYLRASILLIQIDQPMNNYRHYGLFTTEAKIFTYLAFDKKFAINSISSLKIHLAPKIFEPNTVNIFKFYPLVSVFSPYSLCYSTHNPFVQRYDLRSPIACSSQKVDVVITASSTYISHLPVALLS